MSEDALATLLRIRRQALDEAKRALAGAMQRQHMQQLRSEAEETRFAQETIIALDLAEGDGAVDAFARWLPTGREAVQQARVAEQEASAELDRARIVLGLANTAHRSVELLTEKRGEELRLNQMRKAQQAMDELARRHSVP